MDLTQLTVSQLNRAADLKERIDALNSELSSLLSGSGKLSTQNSELSTGGATSGGRRGMSAAGRARIAAAARARWAKYNAAKGKSGSSGNSAISTPNSPLKGKRKMSAAGRAKIAAAARARWAKAKAAGKSRL
jgi:hypothetical protein